MKNYPLSFVNLIRRYILNKSEEISLLKKIEQQNVKKAFLFGSPSHSNMGDQAQTYCICKWIKKYYKDYNIIIFNYYSASNKILNSIKRNIQEDDLIFFHSGYHITDLYKEKDIYIKILKIFPHRKIIIFPQTINFISNNEDKERTIQAINNHNHIILCCRDNKSYENAKKYFSNCKLLLYPDIVTSLIGTLKFNNKREGVLFCIRNDVESLYTKDQINKLRTRLNVATNITDTTIKQNNFYIRKHREKILKEMWEMFSRYKVVVTDRYHGTIFSLIAGTPVVVLSSTDHKLSSGVKWFPECYNDYVTFASNLDEAYNKITTLLNNNTLEYKLPSYFDENYYSVLKQKLL